MQSTCYGVTVNAAQHGMHVACMSSMQPLPSLSRVVRCMLLAHLLAVALEVDAGYYLCVVVLELCCYSRANSTPHP